jgi:hypothetical protein
MIRFGRYLMLVLLIPSAACQSPTSSSSSSTAIDVTVTTDPTFAKAVASTGVTYTVSQSNAPDLIKAFPWKTDFVVAIKNNNAVGMDVSAVTVKVQQAISGIVVPSTTSDTEHYTFNMTPESGSKRINANGSTNLDFTVYYALPNGGVESLVTITVALVNDDSASDTKTVTVQVFPS